MSTPTSFGGHRQARQLWAGLAAGAVIFVLMLVVLPPRFPIWLMIAAALPAVAGSMVGVFTTARSRHELATTEAALQRQASHLQAALETTQRHLLHETALVQCSRVLLETDFEVGFDQALRGLAEATDSDYILVERNVEVPGIGLCSRPERWVARGAFGSDPSEYWRDAPWSSMPKSYKALARGKPHSFSWLSELPEVEKELYSASDPPIRSEIDMPIMIEGRWEGIIGFAHATEGKQWDEWDIELLRTVADLFGAYWLRQAAAERLQEHALQQEQAIHFEQVLAKASAALFSDSADQGPVPAMSALLEISEAHHAYAEVNFIDPTMGLATRTVAHITKDGVELPPSILNTVVAWSQLPRTRDTLASLQPFVAERLEQMEGEWFSYRPVGARIQAELDVPVVIDGAWMGLVGLADDRPRAWTVTEHRMTREVADLFATYWARLQAKKDLEDLVATKDRFIASVSHELRTPLTAVIGLASELAEHRAAFSAEEQDEFVRMIADQSREVGHIVEDLLVAARASETQLTVLAERISLSAEVREVLTQLPGALSLRVNGLLQPVDVFADPLRLRQIIRNLLTNAHRYGGDPIEVRVGNGSGQAFLQVVDHGPGIPESMRDQVFLAYRSAAEVPGRTASIGLGLTVSRQLARLMGGDVTYHYNGESVFELTLPVPSPAA